jgi:molybdate transport system substrate-binding protein
MTRPNPSQAGRQRRRLLRLRRLLRRRRPLRRLFLLLLLLCLLPATVNAATVQVYAAASLTETFRELAVLHERRHPGDEVELNFAGSQTLRTQIEQGAPADVFASADHVHMSALRRQGLVHPDSVFARNRLVVVTPPRDERVTSLADLAQPDLRLALADPNVPAGRYALALLERAASPAANDTRVGASPSANDAPVGVAPAVDEAFVAAVRANVVSFEATVRSALAKVVLGEVDASIVYRTDARTVLGKVRTVEVPEAQEIVAEYPIAVLEDAREPEAAARFVALVLAPEGQAILARHGFEPRP